MTDSPGLRSKYDDIAAELLAKTNAKVCCVIIFDGNKGNGMCTKVRADAFFDPNTAKSIADTLKMMSAQIATHGFGGAPSYVEVVPKPCDHSQFRIAKHGRYCPCGQLMLDPGD